MIGRALLLAAFLAPAGAFARPTVALRLGMAAPLLDAVDRLRMADVMSSQIPIQLDGLWRFTPALGAGAYLSYGLGRAGEEGCAAGDCSASSVRAGLQVYWWPERKVARGDPWLGAGAGWEWATLRRDQPGSEVSYRWNGPEGLVEVGVDWKLGGRVSLGPYLLVTAGSFGRVTLETSAGSASAPIEGRTLHAWVHAGIRGRFDL